MEVMTVCARACVCTQQTASFSSLPSVNQPKENQALCGTPEVAPCLGAGLVSHSVSKPSTALACPHTVAKIRLSLLIKTTGGARGFEKDLPSLPPETRCSIHAHLHPALRRSGASLSSPSLHSTGLRTAQSVPATGESEQSGSRKVKPRRSDVRRREPSLGFQNVLSYFYMTERHRWKQ